MASKVTPKKTPRKTPSKPLDITAGSDVSFTITKTPVRPAQCKTIQRLMRMQPDIQKGLKMLSRRRRQKDNIPTRRAGQIWINRARTTKLTRVAAGESFTIRITPQIISDIKSVQRFLEAKAAK